MSCPPPYPTMGSHFDHFWNNYSFNNPTQHSPYNLPGDHSTIIGHQNATLKKARLGTLLKFLGNQGFFLNICKIFKFGLTVQDWLQVCF